MQIYFVTQDLAVLSEVLSLAKRNRKALGFLTDQVFLEAAGEKRLIVARDQQAVLGYLLFRVAKGRASITHLCVASSYRGQGCARSLFDALKKSTHHLNAITLRCKRTLDGYDMWKAFGFYPCNERPGRSKKGDLLTDFRFDFGKPNLFTNSQSGDPRLMVALDSNVAIALVEQRPSADSLAADWVTAAVRFVVAKEFWNDLDRTIDDQLRKKRFREAADLDVLSPQHELVEKQSSLIRDLFPKRLSDQDRSDLTHLSAAAAANASAFLTQDKELLSRADDVYARTGLSVMLPAELLTQIDRLEQEQAYRPVRIAGCRDILDTRIESPGDAAYDAFRNSGERKGKFDQLLSALIERPKTTEVRQIRLEGEATLLYGVEHCVGRIQIPFLRLSSSRLASTICRRTLWEQILRARSKGVTEVDLLPSAVSSAVLEAAQGLGFSMTGTHPTKRLICRIIDASELPSIQSEFPLLADYRETHSPDFDVPDDAAAFEHQFWPLKVWNAALPTYIVAIEERFATQLFDSKSSGQLMFSDSRLAMNVEGAYYRGGKSTIPKAPGRILWYVKRKTGTGRIIACSRAVEFRREPPKPLFKRFQRLGVFSFQDVLAAARGDLSREVNGVRFDDTELFDQRIPWSSFQKVLRKHGVRTQLQSPARIPPEAFRELYLSGFASPEIR